MVEESCFEFFERLGRETKAISEEIDRFVRWDKDYQISLLKEKVVKLKIAVAIISFAFILALSHLIW